MMLSDRRMPSVVDACKPQPEFAEILTIVRTALRDAVTAPSDRESIDVAGAALLAVADRIRAEVRHA